MPNKLSSLPSEPRPQETISPADLVLMPAAIKRKWETPELNSISTEETESGFIFATKETTTPPTRLLPS